MTKRRLAIYTTVYPGVEPYLSDWYESVCTQTDKQFDLWIGIESIAAEVVLGYTGPMTPTPIWVEVKHGSSPAAVRQRAIEQIVDLYSAVVLVDSDDILEPQRVEAARQSLMEHDVVACGMRVVDATGNSIGINMGTNQPSEWSTLVPYRNLFGLSNTAYRSEILRRCLPIPATCELIDWLLVTRAWGLGADLHFDRRPYMRYRQHGTNMAPILPPFTYSQVLRSTERVLRHYPLVLDGPMQWSDACRECLVQAQNAVIEFHSAFTGSPAVAQAYLTALNDLPTEHLWWWSVANAQLQMLWKEVRPSNCSR